MEIPFLVPYFSLVGWVMGCIPQAPPPLSCYLDGATSQDSILFLGSLILHLRHRITQGPALPPGAVSSTTWVTRETSHLCFDMIIFFKVLCTICEIFIKTL